MPGYVIQSVAQKIDGKWIKQVPEPSDQFAVPAGHVVKGCRRGRA
jgi:hypothetical protein